MLFNYKAIDNTGAKREGSIDAVSLDSAINTLQQRGLVISSIKPEESKTDFLSRLLTPLSTRVKNRDVVVLSRQIATLFESQVSVLRLFKLLSLQIENPVLKKSIAEVAQDIQGGSSIADALAKHPKIFSSFYVGMVRAGEESGQLDKTFNYLADHLERNYEVYSKVTGALIYPTFVIAGFIIVMILMFVLVIPNLTAMFLETGQDLPILTRILIWISDIMIKYGILMLIALGIAFYILARYSRTSKGKHNIDSFKLSLPLLGKLYKKFYVSRVANNMHAMIFSGITITRAIAITADIVDNEVYKKALADSLENVKGGSTFSSSLESHPDIFPSILVQMIKAGEETGRISDVMETMDKFYAKEVENQVDTLVGLIEPAIIVFLGVAVGGLIAAIILPIYSVALSF